MKGKKEEQRDSEMKGRDDRWVQMSLLSAEEQLMPGREIKLMHLWLDVFVLQPLTPAGRLRFTRCTRGKQCAHSRYWRETALHLPVSSHPARTWPLWKHKTLKSNRRGRK